MKPTLPFPTLFRLALTLALCATLPVLAGAQDEPAAGPAGPPMQAPPPPPPEDITMMPLDVTNSPMQQTGQGAANSAASAPAATAVPAASTPAALPANSPSSHRTRHGYSANGTSSAATSASTRAVQIATSTPAPLPQADVAPPIVAASAPAASPAVAATSSPAPSPAANNSIRLNFQNASLADVLNYMSAAAGFIITQEVPVTGTVNVVSQQPVSTDEAVDLLNTILAEKGFVALRSGRILKIIPLADAAKRDLPVNVGANPPDIPRKDNMVTQILPVRFAEVGKLVDNLRPLLSQNATISSNDSSNAIILTDTQANIHRMAEIIHALDTSISGIAQIRVFMLRYSDAKGLADVITQLFAPPKTNTNVPGVPPQFQRFFGGGGNQQAANGPQSEARQAETRVVAVADDTSNSVIVSAPEEVMDEVAEVVARLDTSTSDITETQIFRLQHADATEMAADLSGLYSDTGGTSAGNFNGGNNRGGQNNRGGNPGNPNAAAGLSTRALLQSKVVVVADARTNSVLVSASHDTMAQIGLMIGRLDSDQAKKQHVYVYTLSHADPDNLATILRGMYSPSSSSSSSTATQPSISALATRSLNGASTDVTNSLNTNSSRSGTSGH